MRKIVSLIGAGVVALLLSAQAGKTPHEEYIAKYAATAVNEMYRSGVPASITLAQGLLESGVGRSELAVQGRNHFGIKCHNNWKGKTMTADDDKKGECFRVYDSEEESFRDHSDFLRYRDRYKFLFDLETTDYKGWAHGLKKAGYATDPSYATKLISYIEKYELYRYDTMQPAAAATPTSVSAPRTDSDQIARIPESPLKIEEPMPYYSGPLEEFRFPLSRKMYSKNGVPFIYSATGETWESIASESRLFKGELLRYNDVKKAGPLLPGTVVYLSRKKAMAARGLDKYIVGSDSETLWAISQRFGVTLKSLNKMNSFPEKYAPREGDEILLRPVVPEKVTLKEKPSAEPVKVEIPDTVKAGK